MQDGCAAAQGDLLYSDTKKHAVLGTSVQIRTLRCIYCETCCASVDDAAT